MEYDVHERFPKLFQGNFQANMLESKYLDWFSGFAPEVATMIISALPISELRGAIPFAMSAFGFSPLKAFLFAFLGNIIPPLFILLLIEPISKVLSERSQNIRRFFERLFARTRKKLQKNYETWGALGLLIFVAIPLPMTGAWTGALGAFLFGLPFKKAYPAIVGGVVIAGIITTLVSAGIITIFR